MTNSSQERDMEIEELKATVNSSGDSVNLFWRIFGVSAVPFSIAGFFLNEYLGVWITVLVLMLSMGLRIYFNDRLGRWVIYLDSVVLKYTNRYLWSWDAIRRATAR